MEAHPLVEFCDLELDPVAGTLTRAGDRVDVDPKPLDLIIHLVRNRRRFVSGEELMSELWPDVTVSPAALASALRDARRALADNGTDQRVIQTRRGRGYRFVADVEEIEGPDGQSARNDVDLTSIEVNGEPLGAPEDSRASTDR